MFQKLPHILAGLGLAACTTTMTSPETGPARSAEFMSFCAAQKPGSALKEVCGASGEVLGADRPGASASAVFLDMASEGTEVAYYAETGHVGISHRYHNGKRLVDLRHIDGELIGLTVEVLYARDPETGDRLGGKAEKRIYGADSFPDAQTPNALIGPDWVRAARLCSWRASWDAATEAQALGQPSKIGLRAYQPPVCKKAGAE